MTILMAAAVALAAVILLLWRGKPGMMVAELLLLTGVIAGIAWGILRRPTPLMAALEADRQLGLEELLSSAWLARQSQNPHADAWQSALLSMAESRCVRASSSSVTLARLGPRMWGAVILSTSLVFALALLGPSPMPGATDCDTVSAKTQTSRKSSGAPTSDQYASVIDRPILPADPDDLNASTFGQNSLPSGPDASAKAEDVSDATSRRNAAAAESAKGGSGSARTETQTPDAKPLDERHATRTPDTPHNAGEVAAGAGVTSDRPSSAAAGSSGGIASASVPRSASAPPWVGADWQADIQRAQTALSEGRVPAAYRDLVKGYFSGALE